MPGPPSDPEAFFSGLMLAYRQARSVMAAHQLGVFELLESGPATPEEIASQMGSDAHPTRLLLRALAAIQLLDCADGRFSNTVFASTYLVESSDRYVGNALAFHTFLSAGWERLAEIVQTGQPNTNLAELIASEDQRFERDFARGMMQHSPHAPGAVAQILAADRPRTMLDVGAGPGSFSIALMELVPELHATLLDLPATLGITESLVARSPLWARLTLRAGNYLEGDYGTGFDLVLLSHVTHNESQQGVATMLERSFNALRDGGTVAIHDWVVSPDGTSPVASAFFSLNLATYTRRGQLYSRAEYVQMLERAGFVSAECRELPVGSPRCTSLLTAVRP